MREAVALGRELVQRATGSVVIDPLTKFHGMQARMSPFEPSIVEIDVRRFVYILYLSLLIFFSTTMIQGVFCMPCTL